MKVAYHPAVRGEVRRILRRLDQQSQRVGDQFWEELNRYIEAAQENPLRVHFATGTLRRANLERFPYHFLYRVLSDHIRITTERHHKTHPQRGLRRM